ncbi:MAG: right-handed parallel beta-helix repeat-containing protein [Verrucomicrobiota bacterium]|jgi:hypothetical protein
MKTLAQVEPRTPISALPTNITGPGSYYLTTNLTGAALATGITVLADHVTIDLSGFAIIGAGQVGGTAHAIAVPGPQVDLKVLNGSITLWSGEGVFAPLAVNSKLEDLRVSTVGRTGLDIGDGSEIRDSVVQSNCSYAVGASYGIQAGNHCAIRSCVAQGNSGPGIKTGQNALVTGCVANNNTDKGIFTGDNSLASACEASVNTGANPGDGIFVGYGSSVSGCVACGNAHDGIETINGGSVLGCTVWSNQTDGILVQYGSMVKDCTACANGRDGIGVTLRCQAVGNTCDANLHNGLMAYTGYNRIDGNSFTSNHWSAVDCSASSYDLVVRNNAALNGHANDWNMNNSGIPYSQCAEILQPGINFIVNDPWANFELGSGPAH